MALIPVRDTQQMNNKTGFLFYYVPSGFFFVCDLAICHSTDGSGFSTIPMEAPVLSTSETMYYI